jgi:hypothetical protein
MVISGSLLTIPPAHELVHQHDDDADLSRHRASEGPGDSNEATPQFHFGALLG